MSGPIGRVEPVDLLTGDDGALLLYPSRLVAISPLGAAAFELAAPGIGLEELASRLAERFGVPTDQTPRDATEAVVAHLVAEGVLTDRRDPPSSLG